MTDEHGRHVCTADDPWTDDRGYAVHPDAIDRGTCYEGCCDKWECPHCGVSWTDAHDGEHA
jgi:hypothetical protein